MSSSWKPNVLCLGQAGEYGYYSLGALIDLDLKGFLSEIKYIIGSYIGGMLGAFYGTGIKLDYVMTKLMKSEVLGINISDFSLINFAKNVAIGDINKLRQVLEEIFNQKKGYIPTMKQTYLENHVEITLVTTRAYNTNPVCYINHKTFPEMSIVDAIILSSNSPFKYQRMEYKGVEYISGDWSDPYPIEYYDNGNNNVLGIYIQQNVVKPKMKYKSFENIAHILHITKLHNIILRNAKKTSLKCYHICLCPDKSIKNHYLPDNDDKSTMIKRGMEVGRKFVQDISTIKT